MHIVLATLEYPTEPYRAGGMCWAFAKIARGLKDMGHLISVVVPADNDQVVQDDAGIPVYRYRLISYLPARIEQALTWRLPMSVTRYNHASSLYHALDRLDHKNQIDIIFAAAAPDSYFSAGSRRWKYVTRTSGHWPLMDVSNYMPQTVGSYFTDWMEFLSLKKSDAMIAPSKIHRDMYASMGCKNVQCIPTPMTTVSLSDTPPVCNDAGVNMPRRFVLFYGSLQAKKGSLVLADALQDVLAIHPDLHVVFIGRDLNVPGLGSMAASIREKLSRHLDRVHIKGVLEQSIAFDFIQHAEWVILPSIMDNLPNAMLESLWFAKPTLVTRKSGTDDLIVDGSSGIVVDPNNVEALKTGIERALAMNEDQRKRLGVNAREAVLKACNLGKLSMELESLLVSVIKKNHFLRANPLVVALRLICLRIRWFIHTCRGHWWGTPRREVRRLEGLCARYLPGYRIIDQ